MTVYEAILKVSPALDGLRDALIRARERVKDSPELVAELDRQIAALDAAKTPEGLAGLAAVVADEVKALVARGTADPRPHPSDFAG